MAAAKVAAPGPSMIITVRNAGWEDIQTKRTHNGGDDGIAILPAGSTTVLALPTGAAGAISFVGIKQGLAFRGDESQIEFSFVVQESVAPFALQDIDISYVTGFSLPIVCTCDATGEWLTGCDKKLWSMSHCNNDNGAGSCANPLRSDDGAASAINFFAPCTGEAYTFPRDHAANSNGICQGPITCIVLPN